MRMEYRLARHFMAGHDFYEGVRAAIIDKDQAPRWRPASLANVEDAAVAAFFAPLDEPDLDFPLR
jgi:enoyl-CoA hydratase